jgi:hypothetical protein
VKVLPVGWLDEKTVTVMVQAAEREQSGSVDRQTNFFITLKVVVVGSGVGVGVGGVDLTPSCTQVAFSPGCVHIRFSHSWSTVVSNPLAEPLFWHFRCRYCAVDIPHRHKVTQTYCSVHLCRQWIRVVC